MASRSEEKEAGNTALRECRYPDACAAYTRGLAGGGDAAEEAVLLHNRAVAHLRQSDAGGDAAPSLRSALADADAALALAPSMVKACSTKGTVLARLGRAEDALDAYRGGLALDPAHAGCKEGVRSISRDLSRDETELFPPSSPVVAEELGGGCSRSPLHRLLLLARALVLVLALAALARPVPFITLALVAAAATHAAALVAKHGGPSVAGWREWLQRASMDVSMPSAVLPAALIVLQRPSPLALLASCATDAWYALESAAAVPVLGALLTRVGTAVLPSFLGVPASTAASWNGPKRRSAVAERLLVLASACALGQAGLTVLQLLTPSRSLLACVMLAQVLQMQYSFSPHLRKAVASLHGLVRRAVGHRLCPEPVRAGYAWASAAVYAAATQGLRTAREGGGAAAGGAGGLLGRAVGALSGAARGCVIA